MIDQQCACLCVLFEALRVALSVSFAFLRYVTMSKSIVVWQETVSLVQDAQQQEQDQQQDSARVLRQKIYALNDRLESLPPLPKTAWKKVVRDMQVPLKLGVAFSSAVQHSPTSIANPAVLTALAGLSMLLRTAAEAGLTNGRAAGSLGVSIRQQLQQSGVLPQLAQLMTALAAELRAEAAALGSKSSEELCSSMGTGFHRHVLQQLLMFISSLYPRLQTLWGSPTQTAADNGSTWLTDASGHAEAAMQLCTAGLQHSSSLLQHVLPAVQQRDPQLAAELQRDQSAVTTAVVLLGRGIIDAVSDNEQYLLKREAGTQSGPQARTLRQLQCLLLSPHCLPCLTSLLVMHALHVKQECFRLQEASRRQGQTGSSSRSPSSDKSGLTPSRCQLGLLELLGIAPHLTAAFEGGEESIPAYALPNILTACECCFFTVGEVADCWASGQHQQESDTQQQPAWRLQQQLLSLLPPVLVPCAHSNLLMAAANTDPQQQYHLQVMCLGALEVSQAALRANCCLLQARGKWEAGRPPHPDWLQEVLGAVLQLAGQQLLKPHAAAPAQALCARGSVAGSTQQGSGATPLSKTSQATSSTAAAAAGSSTGSSSHAIMDINWAMAQCTAEMLDVLATLVGHSFLWLAGTDRGNSKGNCDTAGPGLDSRADSSHQCSHRRSNSSTGGDDLSMVAAAAATEAAVFQPQLAVAERLVEVCTTLEAGLRAVTAAVQARTRCVTQQHVSPGCITNCMGWLFIGDMVEATNQKPALLLHLGLAGLEPLPAELRQLYSLLSTVHKLGRYQSAVVPGELCWGQAAADCCCWAAAHTAALLLDPIEPEEDSQDPAPPLFQAVDALWMQQPESSFLPSLVIIGRCCLVWAEQLRQQAPELLLPVVLRARAPGSAGRMQGQEQQEGVQREYSAAWVCIPEMEQQPAAAAAAAATGTGSSSSCWLEWVVNTVSAWAGGVTTPAAQAALAAAAGGESPQQLVQQLQALAAAQQAVRQGLTDASLSALVQQLQASGVMLSSVAVPHFCNNPACSNISGPTDVQLVSGRSCLCGGCRTARYCGRTCQRAAWPQHKCVCNALAAAAATEAAASAGAAE